MHRGHDHDHHHHASGGGHHAHPHGVGHNRRSGAAAQWQAPHLDGEAGSDKADAAHADLDQVEAAFAEGFVTASDPTSFLRLANIPFEAKAGDGTKLILLRVEVDSVVDVGSITPHLGGGSFRYDPLPAKLVSKRRRLQFVYFDGAGLRALSFYDVRALSETPNR